MNPLYYEKTTQEEKEVLIRVYKKPPEWANNISGCPCEIQRFREKLKNLGTLQVLILQMLLLLFYSKARN